MNQVRYILLFFTLFCTNTIVFCGDAEDKRSWLKGFVSWIPYYTDYIIKHPEMTEAQSNVFKGAVQNGWDVPKLFYASMTPFIQLLSSQWHDTNEKSHQKEIVRVQEIEKLHKTMFDLMDRTDDKTNREKLRSQIDDLVQQKNLDLHLQKTNADYFKTDKLNKYYENSKKFSTEKKPFTTFKNQYKNTDYAVKEYINYEKKRLENRINDLRDIKANVTHNYKNLTKMPKDDAGNFSLFIGKQRSEIETHYAQVINSIERETKNKTATDLFKKELADFKELTWQVASQLGKQERAAGSQDLHDAAPTIGWIGSIKHTFLTGPNAAENTTFVQVGVNILGGLAVALYIASLAVKTIYKDA